MLENYPNFPEIEPGKQDHSITAEIYRFVRAFQNIEVAIQSANTLALVYVHVPYMLLSIDLLDNPSVFQNLNERSQIRLQKVSEARAAASPPIQALLARHFYDNTGREKYIARGRAELKNIQTLLQEAANLGLIPSQQEGSVPNGFDLRKWLKKYGIGVDCSGFVRQTLQYLQNTILAGAPPLTDKQKEPEVPFLRCPWVFRMLSENTQAPAQTFARILLPMHAMPGDILVNHRHMRIVIKTEMVQEDGIIFHLAESTSASDIPTGCIHQEDDIGPRIIQVKYQNPDQPISLQTPLWKKESQETFQPEENENTYLIGRYLTLRSFSMQ
jgi:hypothetical protein